MYSAYTHRCWVKTNDILILDANYHPCLVFFFRNDRYDALRICLGEDTLTALHRLNLFMVGCGAIGCEMLKNYALIGIAAAETGKVGFQLFVFLHCSGINNFRLSTEFRVLYMSGW